MQMFSSDHAVAQIFVWRPVELIKANSELICGSDAFAWKIKFDFNFIVLKSFQFKSSMEKE